MQYFLPFWPGDAIYTSFDPWEDTWDRKSEEKRIWEVFNRPPIDGVLVSLVNIKRTRFLRKNAEEEGIHKALRFEGPVMGDCGAFSYVNRKETPDPIETLKYYKRLGFNLCVTVDHLIVNTIRISREEIRKLTEEEKKERWETTLKNAEKMYEEMQKSEYEGVRLIGVTQGLDPKTYAEGVRRLLDYGFEYIGLGGLARKPTKYIVKVLNKVHREIRKEIRKRSSVQRLHPRIGLHLFGVARENLFEKMFEFGVTSFDSASPLRTAWTSSVKNYRLNNQFYAAVRIPFAKHEEEEELVEAKVFQDLKRFKNGQITVDEFIEELRLYASDNISPREKAIKRTLHDKPWEKCDCPLCKEIGIHMCIFRRSERNMRRGFHNVYHFYNLLRKRIPRILAFTQCSRKKDPDERLLSAYRRYAASSLFKTFWKNTHDLPIEIGILSGRYMLITWDTRIPKYDEPLSSEKIPKVSKNLENQLAFYEKVFFIGLGKYRDVVMQASENLSIPIEIFPKKELSRGKLDIIEYNRQMRYFRKSIEEEIKQYPMISQQLKFQTCIKNW